MQNSIGQELLLIPPGEFIMGSPATEPGRSDDEEQHHVTIAGPFLMAKTAVTQMQWKIVMATEPWKGKRYVREGDNYPAVYVSWNEAVEFCKKLSQMESKTYRLPTEAEWEYACRAGTDTMLNITEINLIDQYAWCYCNTFALEHNCYPHEVAQKLPNGFGLHDMHGNVFELCSDFYEEYVSPQEKNTLEAVDCDEKECMRRIMRGGYFSSITIDLRCAKRQTIEQEDGCFSVGFRVCREF